MIILLLTLLVIALMVTVAGYLLSAKTVTPKMHMQRPTGRLRNQQVVYAPPRRRAAYSEYPYGPQPQAQRYRATTEPHASLRISLLSMAQQVFRWRVGEPMPLPAMVTGLVAIFLVGLVLFAVVLPHRALIGLATLSGDSAPQAGQGGDAPLPLIGASKALARVGQLDPSQYTSQQEYGLWSYSACSAAAITEVINAYGHNYRVTDILQVEARIHEITPDQGLLEEIGIERTVARFGFTTNWGHAPSLDHIIAIANSGRPVIVSFPPDRYTGGHLLVVIGGNSSYVYLADSSRWNRKALTHAQFLHWWEGFYAVVTPNQ